MAAPPYQKLFWGSYYKHTSHLQHAREHGAYLLLIGALWNNDGRLPADDETLASYAQLPLKEWMALKPKLFRPGLLKIVRGKLSQPRVTEDLAKYRDTSGKRKVAGKAGGEASAEKQRGNRPANARRLPPISEPESEDISPQPPEGDRANFEQALAAYPLAGKNSIGPEVIFAAWAAALDVVAGEARLLEAVRAHAAWHAANPNARVKRMDRWLRDGGFAPYLPPAIGGPADWTGPAEIFDLVARCMGDAKVARGYMRHCRWQEVPRKAIVAPFRFTAEKIDEDAGAALAERGVSVIFAERGAA